MKLESTKLGITFGQLNPAFWQDVAVDWRKGRIYMTLPDQSAERTRWL